MARSKYCTTILTVTQEETERMIRLVNALLQLSKLDSTEHRLMKEWVDFTDFFNNIIDRFEMSKEQNVSFKRSFSKNLDLLIWIRIKLRKYCITLFRMH